MIADIVSQLLQDHGWQWSINGELTQPSVTDVERLLDEAASRLYNEPPGTQLEIGHLIISKNNFTYDVYVHVGEYRQGE